MPKTTPSQFPDPKTMELLPGEKLILEIKGVSWAFIYCPPTGRKGFLMGSPKNEPDRFDSENQHKVVLTRHVFLMDTVVTQGQYQAVMEKNPSFFPNGDNLPVERVSWIGFQELVEKLNSMKDEIGVPDPWAFVIPTEATWEYACRNFGESLEPFNAGSLDECGWYSGNSGKKTHEVRMKKPNKYGFYDFHGNVWEWVYDSWKNPLGRPVTDPCFVTDKNVCRVIRGGCSFRDARSCRAACRSVESADVKGAFLGARLALILK